MNRTNFLWILGLLMMTNDVWAYGSGSSSKKACDKPKFSEFVPADKAKVSAKSEFSFKVSAAANPESIKVSVKDQPVVMTVSPISQGFLVKGTLPESLQGTFARISISAEGMNKCKGSDGWLVNIAD